MPAKSMNTNKKAPGTNKAQTTLGKKAKGTAKAMPVSGKAYPVTELG